MRRRDQRRADRRWPGMVTVSVVITLTVSLLAVGARVERPEIGLVSAHTFAGSTHQGSTGPAGSSPPPRSGYFTLVSPGHFFALPTDSQAAAMVHESTWEPRPQNATADDTVAPSSFRIPGYAGMVHHAEVFGRVDGDFTGTTDEIIQWAAAKWGLPDEVIRAEATVESSWYQDLKTSNGSPIEGSGYGDFGSCGGSPPASGYGANGPASFGLLQDKWCSFVNPDASNYGGWPWTERSTAYSIDLYAATIRGCYEGWDTWLGGDYHAGDLWGCVGRWYSGQWYSPAAKQYIALVRSTEQSAPWLTW